MLFTEDKTLALSRAVHFITNSPNFSVNARRRGVAIYPVVKLHVCKYNACIGNIFISVAIYRHSL